MNVPPIQSAAGSLHDRQRGVVLFVVIVFVLLSTLLAVWGSRTAWFSELVVGNDADYQRAFEAAQALLQDAELDIRGERADGKACTPDNGDDKICRHGTTLKIPLETREVGGLLATLESQNARCKEGLCAKRLGRQDFWNYISTATPTPANIKDYEIGLDELSESEIGARYGDYTGAAAVDNPILEKDPDDPKSWDKGGWYWIEVLKYDESSQYSGLIENLQTVSRKKMLTLNLLPSVVYRITAVAYGRKPSSMVVLQETYARTKRKD